MPFVVDAQEAPVVYPGSAEYNPSIFQPFEAVYSQGGFEMIVKFHKSGGPNPIFTAFMMMPDPTDVSRMNVDVIGHYATDMSFAYRKFSYGRFRNEYIHAEHWGDSLKITRMELNTESGAKTYQALPISTKFMDGTMAFWLLAGLPLQENYGARFYRWDVKADSVGFIETLPFFVKGDKEILTINNIQYECWPLEAKLASGMILRSYISKQAPYLIAQDAIQPTGEIVPFLKLLRVVE